MREEDIIQQIADIFAEYGALADAAAGFIDDGAAIQVLQNKYGASLLSVTTDMVVEYVDFRVDMSPVESAGHRAIAQNISDLAAMGVEPIGFVWALAIPKSWQPHAPRRGNLHTQEQNEHASALLWRFVEGAASMAGEAQCPIYGGDLSSTTGPFVCSVTAFGRVVTPKALTRRGAQVGDAVYIGRPLGASAMGLQILLRDFPVESTTSNGTNLKINMNAEQFRAYLNDKTASEIRAIQKHLWYRPQLELSQRICKKATACLDVSDGFYQDAQKLCKASRVGIVLHADWQKMMDPCLQGLSDDTQKKQQQDIQQNIKNMLCGGEDYALLFTMPASRKVETNTEIEIYTGIYIGDVVEEMGIWIRQDEENDGQKDAHKNAQKNGHLVDFASYLAEHFSIHIKNTEGFQHFS